MAKINIYFQDLRKDAKNEIWNAVEKELLETKQMSPNTNGDERHEIIDDYINRNNFANAFVT